MGDIWDLSEHAAFLRKREKNGKGFVLQCESGIDRNVFYAYQIALSTFKAPYFYSTKFIRRGEQLRVS